jgi:aminoglycoside phosphotransferase (APT) family kinase protein
VLDWELSTLGDPLSDAALMCVYRDAQFDLLIDVAAWTSPLLPAVDELAHRYSTASEQPLSLGLLDVAGVLQVGHHRGRH